MARHKAEEAEYNEVEPEVADLGAAYQVNYSLTELLAALKPKAD